MYLSPQLEVLFKINPKSRMLMQIKGILETGKELGKRGVHGRGMDMWGAETHQNAYLTFTEDRGMFKIRGRGTHTFTEVKECYKVRGKGRGGTGGLWTLKLIPCRKIAN